MSVSWEQAQWGLYGAGLFTGLGLLLHLFDRKIPGTLIVILGLLSHVSFLLSRGFAAGVFYANPIFEGPFYVPFCLAMAALWAGVTGRKRALAATIVSWGAAFVFALLYARGVIPPTPKKLSLLAPVFFMLEGAGYALFLSAAAVAAAELFGRKNDEVFHGIIVWGFVIFSLSQVIGAAWCFQGWGNTFRWSPRHFSSAAVWILYAAYLHQRYVPGPLKGKRSITALAGGLVTCVVVYGNYWRELQFFRVGG